MMVSATRRRLMTTMLGLDDVIAAATVLRHVDGEAGRLIIRGHDLEELAGRVSYEAAVATLSAWTVPGARSEREIRAALGLARDKSFGLFEPLTPRLAALSPVEGMRLLLSALPDAGDDHAALAVGAAGVAAAMAIRAGGGLAPVAPDSRAGHAADCLRMIRGLAAGAEEI